MATHHATHKGTVWAVPQWVPQVARRRHGGIRQEFAPRVRRLGLVKFQGARSVVTPLPEVNDPGRLHPCQTAPGRFQDNEANAIDEICVFPKHLVELVRQPTSLGGMAKGPSSVMRPRES